MSKDRIRIGIVGTGYVAQNNFFPVLPRFDDVEIVGVVSKNQEHARKGQRLCGAEQALADYRNLADLGLDGVFILTPKQLHAEQISFFLNHGVDVYCEKPMATSMKDADLLVNLSEKTGKKLMIGFNRRYAPVCVKAKSVYADEGPDVIIGQKNRPKTEYRATLENAIHIVDLMRYFGGEVKDVHATSKFADPYYETYTTAMLTFESGATGLLTADRSAGQWEETIEMHGGNRSVFIEMPNSVTITDGQEKHITQMTPLASGWAKSEDNMGFTYSIRHFLDCIKENKKPMTDAVDAYKTQELLYRILKSAGLPLEDKE